MTSLSRSQNAEKAARLAGSWYPGTKVELSAMLDRFFALAKLRAADRDVGVIISPHAGFDFSGTIAANGFQAAQSRKITTVIILAPTHHYNFSGASIWPAGGFTTPLGRIEVDADLANSILKFDKRFVFRQDVFEGGPGRPENSVETQLPFIQKAFPGARIVPVIVGYPPEKETLQVLAEALVAAIADRQDVLVDVSVDQSHFHPDTQARQIDARGLDAITRMDLDALLKGHATGAMEVDGFHVVAAAMMFAKKAGYDKAEVLSYATSADVTKEKDRVVGYASVAFYREHKELAGVSALGNADDLQLVHKEHLLKIAREAVETFVRTGKTPGFTVEDERLRKSEGAFVTLHKGGQLRGCIGMFVGRGPLYLTVRDMAIAAASQDPRFIPVKSAELKDIDLEISVLSSPRKVKSVDEIVMGTHGVIVSRGSHRGVFLPQVATETGWSREQFLSELCSQKAGLPQDCWKDPATVLEIFTADVFSEKK